MHRAGAACEAYSCRPPTDAHTRAFSQLYHTAYCTPRRRRTATCRRETESPPQQRIKRAYTATVPGPPSSGANRSPLTRRQIKGADSLPAQRVFSGRALIGGRHQSGAYLPVVKPSAWGDDKRVTVGPSVPVSTADGWFLVEWLNGSPSVILYFGHSILKNPLWRQMNASSLRGRPLDQLYRCPYALGGALRKSLGGSRRCVYGRVRRSRSATRDELRWAKLYGATQRAAIRVQLENDLITTGSISVVRPNSEPIIDLRLCYILSCRHATRAFQAAATTVSRLVEKASRFVLCASECVCVSSWVWVRKQPGVFNWPNTTRRDPSPAAAADTRTCWPTARQRVIGRSVDKDIAAVWMKQQSVTNVRRSIEQTSLGVLHRRHCCGCVCVWSTYRDWAKRTSRVYSSCLFAKMCHGVRGSYHALW